MKYYFITYMGRALVGKDNFWNDIINVSPAEFITEMNSVEDKDYSTFVLTFAIEISNDEYYRQKDNF